MARHSASGPHDNGDWTVGIVGLVFMAVIASLFLRELVIRTLSFVLYILWQLADFPRIHAYAAERITLLAQTHNQAENVTWGEFITVLNFSAGILLVALVPLAVTGIIAVRNSQAARTRRPLNVRTLPRIMGGISPGIIPALQYGDPKTQLLNADPPEHRWAMWPEEFAVKHRLVINHRLDRDRATRVFIAQLGRAFRENVPEPPAPPPVQNRWLNHLRQRQHRQKISTPLHPYFRQFSPHEQALFAVFGLQHFLDKRQDAERLLDTLNRSTLNRKQPGYPLLHLAERDFYRVARTPEAVTWVTQYSRPRTALSALHDNDLHLPGARFRWLKGLDRPLWYALSSTGRPVPFIEGAAIVSQAQWERLAAGLSVPLKKPVMTQVLEALEEDLIAIGAVQPPPPEPEPTDEEDDAGDDDTDPPDAPGEAPQKAAATHRHVNTFRPRVK